MINTQKLCKHLWKCLFLFGLLFPALDYATEPVEEPASVTNSTWMEPATESTAGDIELPLGALHILPGQEADSVTTVLTRIQRSTEKLAPEGGIESKSNSTTAEASATEEREISFSSGSFTPSTGLDPSMASEVLAMGVNGRDFVYGFILLDEHLGEETQQELEALGVTLLGPHGNNLYKAKFPLNMEVIAQVTQLSYVEWVGYSTQDQKLDGDLKKTMDIQAGSATGPSESEAVTSGKPVL
jgi:hypothetical protein